MERAIELAQRWLHTHPNPRVGAVIVGASGEVLAEGWHRGPGSPHAEIVALESAARPVAGSTVYVTLEPCVHHGRTPPCTDALIAAGVARVVVGALDPDPRVSGSGVETLTNAGIEVVTGVDEKGARRVDPGYFAHRETSLPYVTLKWAMTVDGSVSAADGSSQWITGESARADAHELRSRVDAVAIGAGTLRGDDPRLDVRLSGYTGPQPRPVVVAGLQPLPESAQIWSRDPLVVSTFSREIPGGELVTVAGDEGRPDPAATCRELADRGLLHILLEGGPGMAGSWWRAGLIGQGVVYVGSKLGGGAGVSPLGGVFESLDDAVGVEFTSVRNVGDDMVIVFEKRV